jgi:hypothetical protein
MAGTPMENFMNRVVSTLRVFLLSLFSKHDDAAGITLLSTHVFYRERPRA